MTLLFIIVGAFLGFPIAGGCLGLMVGFILAITVWPKNVSRLKAGKPHGYLMKRAIKLLVSLKLLNSPWTYYKGPWQKNKTIEVNDV